AFDPGKNIQRLLIGKGLTGSKKVLYEGEDAKLDVLKDDGTISQYHAALVRDETGSFWHLVDAGSDYGTFVGTKKLQPGEAMPVDTDMLVQLGDGFKLHLVAVGKLLEIRKNTSTIVRFNPVQAQKRLAPPSPADSFPLEKIFPDHNVPADVSVEVARLT